MTDADQLPHDIEPISAEPPHLLRRTIAVQRWSEAVFVHWKVDASLVAPFLPAGTTPDLHEGGTWVGLIAFRLSEASLGPIGPVPWLSDFCEINVRLYAVDGVGRRGVVFRSLEASPLLSVLLARAGFGLPYKWARTRGESDGRHVRYSSRRHFSGAKTLIEFEANADVAAVDTTAEFLTARWRMFVERFGRTHAVSNVHPPWQLHPARVLRLEDELLAEAGFPDIAQRTPDSVLYSPGVHATFGTIRTPADGTST